MKLSKKTFLYSILITVLLVSMIVIYFVTMLPSLYVDYMKNENLKAIVNLQKGYIQNHSYAGLTVSNPTGSVTLELPLEGDEIYLTGVAFKMTLTAQDENIRTFLDQLRGCLKHMDDIEKADFDSINWDLLKNSLTQSSILKDSAPISVKVAVDNHNTTFQNNGSVKYHAMGSDMIVLEMEASDTANQYTTYVAMGKSNDSLILSILPVMTPQMKEIKPIVLGSLPMITAVLFLIVLICSQYFSRKIVTPVIRLANYAEAIKTSGNGEVMPITIKEQDEIGELGRTLNELYSRLRANYVQLEEKNDRLKKENKRQEVFLRASSHQLKTPVTAALLLVDGMIQEVGKYKDTKTYLPQVKEQLQSMRKIVEEILYLNHCMDHLHTDEVDVKMLTEEFIQSNQVLTEAKKLSFVVNEAHLTIKTDGELLKKILDNLLSNAVVYTRDSGEILVDISDSCIRIFNRYAHIPEELLPHIYEPFVSENRIEKGKGLGLYVCVYYSEALGFKLSIDNEDDGVSAVLYFTDKEPSPTYMSSSYELHTHAVESN